MNAEQFNALHPVGTPVIAYPGTRPEYMADTRGFRTRTRSVAWLLGHGEPVVMVDGYPGGIVLEHVDVEPAMPRTGDEERLLTTETLPAVDNWVDGHGDFAKSYTEFVNGELVTTGLRIGGGRGRLIARFGEAVVRRADGTYRRIVVVPAAGREADRA